MAATTVYDVRVNLSMQDRLTPGVRRQSQALAVLQRQARGATSTIDRLAKAAAFGFGVKSAYGWLVKYNAEVDDLKRKLSTIIMLNTGGDWTRAFGMASELTVKLREDAKLSAGTMQDMVGFAAAIANPVLAAGGSMEQLRDFTRQAVVAAAALGERADLAQLDITQALQGTLTQRDRFARALLSPMGISNEQFNAMSGKKRFNTMLQAVNSPAIGAAMKSYEKAFSGATSTLKDNFQQLGGKIGDVLFQSITSEAIKINTWFQRNQRQIGEFATKAGKFIGEAFGAARSAIQLLVEHKDLLLTLAKAYLISKGVGLLTGPIGGLGRLAQAAGLAGQSLAALPGILALVAGAASGMAGIADDMQSRRIERDAQLSPFLGQAREMNRSPGRMTPSDFERARQMGYSPNYDGVQMANAGGILRRARELGILGRSGGINEDRLREAAISGGNLSLFDRARGGADPIMKEMRDAIAEAQLYGVRVAEIERRRQMLATIAASGKTWGALMLEGAQQAGVAMFNPLFKVFGVDLKSGNAIRSPKPPEVNVGKLVIEVHSDDPDRFYMGLQGYFQDWVRNPSQAPTALREGR